MSIPKQEVYPRPVTLRPSSSSSWTKCSMAPWLLHKNKRIIPPPSDEEWTHEGSEAHQRAYLHLSGERALRDPHDPVWTYVRAVDRAQDGNSLLLLESKSPTFYDPGYEGTVDAALIHLEGTRLDIFDLKYGQGQEVAAERNTQMMIYWRSLYELLTAAGLMDHMEYTQPVSLTIVQPRHWKAQRISTWDTTVGELMQLTDIIELQAEKIYAKRGLEYAPHEDTCRFCPAKAVCVKRYEWELEHLPELEGDIPAMDMSLVAELYERRRKIKSWLDSIEKFVADSVTHKGPMYDLYEWTDGKRKGNTRWVNESKVQKFLRQRFEDLKPSDFVKKQFLSPNEMLAMVLDRTGESIGKEVFEEEGLTFRPDAKKVIARRKPGSEKDLGDLEAV